MHKKLMVFNGSYPNLDVNMYIYIYIYFFFPANYFFSTDSKTDAQYCLR